MYEELIEFLLGRREELTDDDLDKFVDLLASALEVTEEYDIHKKQSLIANMVNCTNVVDKRERAEIASAIDKILQFEVSEDDGVNIFGSEDDGASVPLRSRKFTRGQPKSRNGDGDEEGKRDRVARDIVKKQQTEPDLKKGGIKAGSEVAEPLSEEEQEDLLRSICDVPCTPDKRQKLSIGQSVKFNELFSSKTPENNNKPKKVAGNETTSSDFKFEIGELEENHNDGPEYVFEIDDSEDQ